MKETINRLRGGLGSSQMEMLLKCPKYNRISSQGVIREIDEVCFSLSWSPRTHYVGKAEVEGYRWYRGAQRVQRPLTFKFQTKEGAATFLLHSPIGCCSRRSFILVYIFIFILCIYNQNLQILNKEFQSRLVLNTIHPFIGRIRRSAITLKPPTTASEHLILEVHSRKNGQM